MTLTARQARFCDEYVISGNSAASARAAGYSARTARQIGSENLTKPDIQAALEARRRVTAQELQLTRQDLIRSILGAIKTAQEVSKPAVVISGWREIGKLCGFYTPEVIRVQPLSADADGVLRHLESLPTNQLLEMVAKKRAMTTAAAPAMP